MTRTFLSSKLSSPEIAIAIDLNVQFALKHSDEGIPIPNESLKMLFLDGQINSGLLKFLLCLS